MLIEKQPYYILSHEHACIAMKRKEIAILMATLATAKVELSLS